MRKQINNKKKTTRISNGYNSKQKRRREKNKKTPPKKRRLMNAKMAEGSAAETPANGERKELGFLRPVWQMNTHNTKQCGKKTQMGLGDKHEAPRNTGKPVKQNSSRRQAPERILPFFTRLRLKSQNSSWYKKNRECPSAIHVRQWRHIVYFDTDSMFSRLKLHYCKETLLALANRTTSIHRRQGSSLSIPAKPLFPSPSHHQVLKQRSIGKTWRQRQIKRRSRSACGACALKIETCAKTPSLLVTSQTLPEKKMEPT